MIFDQEFLFFDIVIHAFYVIDNRMAYVTTYNRRIKLAANDA